MSAEEYQVSLRIIIGQMRVISLIDIPGYLEAIERADAFGCFTDPTLWINNRDKMNEDRQLLEAALPLWKLAQKLKERRTP